MKIFVTGGTGFIGSHLIEASLAEGAEVYALIRNPKKPGWLAGLNVHFLKGNLFSIPSLPRDVDTVFHLAGLAKSYRTADYYTVNHLGTASLLESLARQKLEPRIIYVSSIAAGGPSPEGCVRGEDDPPRPVSPYGWSKLLAEREVLGRRKAWHVTVLRPGVVFGPRDLDLLSMIKVVKRGLLPKMFGGKLHVSSCYIRDFVQALLLCLRPGRRSGGIYNISDADPPNSLDMGRIASRLMGRASRIVPIPRPVVYLYAQAATILASITGRRPTFNFNLYQEMKQGSWVVDVRKAAKELSFRAQTPFEAAMSETVDWYRRAGWI